MPKSRVTHRVAALATILTLAVTATFAAPSRAQDVNFQDLPGNGLYQPLSPARLLDTRGDNGGHAGKFAGPETFSLAVAGRGGVPAAGASAVALNVTVTDPSAPSFLTVHPSGVTRPLASNLNFIPGQTVPNMVIAKLGSDGNVAFFNNNGETHVIVDVVGYWTEAISTPTGSGYVGLTPNRILDTRTGGGALAQGEARRLVVTGAEVPEAATTAVALNVTVTGPTGGGFLTVYPDGEDRPTASNLNFAAGQTVPNMVLAKVGAGGAIRLYNNTGSTHVVVDVVGYFSAGDEVGQQVGISPVRLLDTRDGAGSLGTAETGTLLVTGVAGVPRTGISAVALNVTATGPTAGSFLTVWPTGQDRPTASNLNVDAGQTVPNMVLAKVGDEGRISIYNNFGSVDIIVDIVGYYTTGVPNPNRTAGPQSVQAEARRLQTLAKTAAAETVHRNATIDHARHDAVLAAVAPGDSASAAAIVEGTPLRNLFQQIGVIEIYVTHVIDRGTPAEGIDARLLGNCSGSVVAANLVLTAFHCVDERDFDISDLDDPQLVWAFVPAVHGTDAPFGVWITSDYWFDIGAVDIPDATSMVPFQPALDYALLAFDVVPADDDSAGQLTLPGDVVGTLDVITDSPGGPRLTIGYGTEGTNCPPTGDDCFEYFCVAPISGYVAQNEGLFEVASECAIGRGTSGGPVLELFEGAWRVVGVVSLATELGVPDPSFRSPYLTSSFTELYVAAGPILGPA